MFTLGESGISMHPQVTSLAQWPWTWLRVHSYVKVVRNIHERAGYDDNPKTAIPPRRIWFDDSAVDDWFDSRRKARKKQR